ncbi:hypothetical protein [Catalinimonas niigatensis]|uniref:hypothetical protein n=1 Tax=Catalinimonas niigatensis TaxID=1397264 RepID=UPI002665869D|nr:hypothetical protein [Catalinimonas niigatensis]WPP49344.1 hypothetical protein PZB72_21990 [Catalinimonas niigatensis]
MKISSFNQSELTYYVNIGVQAVSTIPELEVAMAEVGLSLEKVKVGNVLSEDVLNWQTKQEETLSNASKAKRHLNQAREAIDSIYTKHRIAARFVYREDEDMLKKLQLQGNRKKRYPDWLDQVQQFYKHLDAEVLKPIGILPKEVTEVKKLIAQLTELQVVRLDSRRQAQQTTEIRQKAVLKLRQWYRHFMSTAELACQDNPQLLEAMGVVVPSK